MKMCDEIHQHYGNQFRGPGRSHNCIDIFTRLLNRFFLAHKLFGLVRGGSRGLLGGPRKSPTVRRMALEGRPGPRDPGQKT